MICGFCVYYSFAFESYPISVATYGYSFNATCSAVAGVVIPFIIEYIEEKYVFLIYAIEGVVCTLLFLFLKETRGIIIALANWMTVTVLRSIEFMTSIGHSIVIEMKKAWIFRQELIEEGKIM